MTANMEYIENALSYEIYHELRNCVGWKNWSEEQARKALKNSAYNIVVQDGAEAVAMARLIGDGIYYIIVDVVVVPSYQGQGIGQRLIEMLLEYVTQNQPAGSRVSVQLIAEKGKEGFYEKLGFKTIPHEFCGSGMRKVMYKE